MEHIGGFMRSHYMLQSGVCSHGIGPADAMVIAVAVGQNTTKKTIFSYCLWYFFTSKLSNFVTRKGPSTHVIDVTSFV
jgi:hypothetical protein